MYRLRLLCWRSDRVARIYEGQLFVGCSTVKGSTSVLEREEKRSSGKQKRRVSCHINISRKDCERKGLRTARWWGLS
jgi:hypothetical protein